MGTFAMVVLAFYTAGLTSNLVVTNALPTAEVSDMGTAIRLSLVICTERVAGAATRARPTFSNAIWARDDDGEVGIIRRSDIFDYLDTGRCDVAVARSEDFAALQAQNKHCNKTLVGQPIDTVFVGFPIRRETIQSALTYHQQQLLANGVWGELSQPHNLKGTLSEILGINNFTSCPVRRAEPTSDAIGFDQLQGLLFICGLGVLLGLLLSMGERGRLYYDLTKRTMRDLTRDVEKSAKALAEEASRTPKIRIYSAKKATASVSARRATAGVVSASDTTNTMPSRIPAEPMPAMRTSPEPMAERDVDGARQQDASVLWSEPLNQLSFDM